MKKVAIESPYAGDVEKNVAYAKRCLLDSLKRGEAGFAMHLLYPQVLDDLDPEQRRLGIESGLTWTLHADLVACYFDLGYSDGMELAIKHAMELGIPIQHRSLDGRAFPHVIVMPDDS